MSTENDDQEEIRQAGVAWRKDYACIRTYLRILAEHSALNTGSPLCIVDLAPGDGERAWQLLRMFNAQALPLRYIAACPTDAARTWLYQNAALLELHQAGLLQIEIHPACISDWQRLLPATSNPIVILAHDAFGALPHKLYACHYGQWLNAKQENADAPWQACGIESGLSALLAPAYLHSLNSNAFLVPTGAIDLLSPLIAASHGNYFLISSGKGASELSQIRLGALHVEPQALLTAAQLPINFHALSVWQTALGAQCTNLQGEQLEGQILQLAIRHDANPSIAERLPELAADIETATDRSTTLETLAASIADAIEQGLTPSPQAFALWRAADDSPAVMLSLANALVTTAENIDSSMRSSWYLALRRACCQRFPKLEDDGFHFTAALIAATLGVWSWAIDLLENGAGLYGQSIDTLRFQAYCMRMCGRSGEALELLEQTLLENPKASSLLVEYRALRMRLREWDALPWYQADIDSEKALRLEPLGEEHAESFLHQYRDPQIGMMARLPDLKTPEEVAAWIIERGKEPGRMEFALMHADFGFAGVVSAHRVGKSAFFHFWIGVDFQGQGLSIFAFKLLHAQLSRLHVKRIFTTVYPDNFRSLRVLEKCGFQAMPDRALPPEEDMPFFCLELKASRGVHENSVALREYSRRSGGVFIFPQLAEPCALASPETADI